MVEEMAARNIGGKNNINNKKRARRKSARAAHQLGDLRFTLKIYSPSGETRACPAGSNERQLLLHGGGIWAGKLFQELLVWGFSLLFFVRLGCFCGGVLQCQISWGQALGWQFQLLQPHRTSANGVWGWGWCGSVARASSRGGHGEDAAAGPRVRTGFCAGIQVHLPGKSFKGSLNTFPPHSPCFAFSFFKHLIITLINTFWDNSSWLPSNLNQHLLAYCYVCVVCKSPA